MADVYIQFRGGPKDGEEMRAESAPYALEFPFPRLPPKLTLFEPDYRDPEDTVDFGVMTYRRSEPHPHHRGYYYDYEGEKQ